MRLNMIKHRLLVKWNRALAKFLLLSRQETRAIEKVVRPKLAYYIEIKCFRTMEGNKYEEQFKLYNV